MDFSNVLEVLEEDTLSLDDAFDAFAFATQGLLKDGQQNQESIEVIIRLLDARKRGALPRALVQPLEFAVQQAGLFPYLERKGLSIADQTVVYAHSVGEDRDFVLHEQQMGILLRLLQGENVILSAPTSYGKSAIVDAFLEKSKPNTVVIVVPTIALIDETRRRLQRKFSDYYSIIFHRAQSRIEGEPTIYVLTQERLLDRQDIEAIDFFVVDEFYKLDPVRMDPRHQTLNIAVYRYSKLAKQIYMAGPHISSISLGDKWRDKFVFVQTDYKTVSSNVIDRTEGDEDLFERFYSDYKNTEGEALIFTASPPSANKLLMKLLNKQPREGGYQAAQIASWLSSNYHPSWNLVRALKAGYGIHHGRVPRSIAHMLVRDFDGGALHSLICTSTLIEGVNTSAKDIFIYDKRISTKNFDFFSFANIRGRVGRMMRHYVGNVFLYYKPPEDELVEVDVPIFNEPSAAEDAILVNVDSSDLGADGVQRRDDLLLSSGLPMRILQRYASMGVENLLQALEEIELILDENPKLLVWHGIPSADQRKKVIELAWNHFLKNTTTGAKSAAQLAYYASQLSRISTFPKFFRWFVSTNNADDSDAFDFALAFLRCCDFSLPNAICLVEELVNLASLEGLADYRLYAKQLEDFFRPEWVRALDELGVPIPIGERFKGSFDPEAQLDEVVSKLVEMIELDSVPDDFDAFDKKVLREALTKL